jgi:hypothetical protein
MSNKISRLKRRMIRNIQRGIPVCYGLEINTKAAAAIYINANNTIVANCNFAVIRPRKGIVGYWL